MAVLDLSLIGVGHATIPAEIRTLDLVSDSLQWYTDWFPRMYDLSGNRIYEDSNWDVPKIWETCQAEGSKIIVLEADGSIQGYAVLNFQHVGLANEKCTYIQFLASAPWNRKHSVDGREIINVGKVLVGTSCLLGFSINDSPTVELHSLSKAESFYHKIGLRETGRIKKNFKEYRMEPDKGFELIRFLTQFINK